MVDLAAWTAASIPPTTHLLTACYVLNVLSHDGQDCFGDDAVGSVADADGPGCLSRVMRRHARSGAMEVGCTYDEHILLAAEAREAPRSFEAPLWLVQRRLHWCESRPEGPAATLTLRAAERIVLATTDLKITGCGSCGSHKMMQLLWAGWPGGCLLVNISLTVGEFGFLGSAGSSRWTMPPFPPWTGGPGLPCIFPGWRRSEPVLHCP